VVPTRNKHKIIDTVPANAKRPFTSGQIVPRNIPGIRIAVGPDHPNFRHMTVLPEPMRTALSADFD
jgi:hypothetical protein